MRAHPRHQRISAIELVYPVSGARQRGVNGRSGFLLGGCACAVIVVLCRSRSLWNRPLYSRVT